MKESGYIKLWRWYFFEGLSLKEIVALAYIADACEIGGGHCERSLRSMAEDLQVSLNTLRGIIDTLAAREYIVAEAGKWRGSTYTITLGKGFKNCTLSKAERVQKLHPFKEEKGSKIERKGFKNCTLSEKEKRTKKEKDVQDIFKTERVRESARTHEPSLSEADAVEIVRRYEGRMHDPNGREYNPTDAETAEYNEALEAVSRYKTERAEAEFAEVMARYPDLLQWKQQPTADHYARLVSEYGKTDVEEAMQYAANRIDLKYQYLNPLGYVEGNIKGRKAGIRGSKPAARR